MPLNSPWSFILLNKIKLRNELRLRRKGIPAAERMAAALSAASQLITHSSFLASKNIGCYLATEEEFDCKPIIQAIWHTQKNCYLPILSSQEKFLAFGLYRPEDKLHLNRYKILEPENTLEISAAKLDLALIPLVGFDLKGNRLGMGGGCYDRTFAFLLEKKPSKPRLIGLAYENQLLDNLPQEEWDVPLCGVLTEKRFLLFNQYR